MIENIKLFEENANPINKMDEIHFPTNMDDNPNGIAAFSCGGGCGGCGGCRACGCRGCSING